MQTDTVKASVVDLFCGAGGLSHGFRLERFPIAAGIDLDEDCQFPFEQNNDAPFLCRDVTSLTANEVTALFRPGMRTILVGCAPCQPFSTYNQKNNDPNWKLLGEFGKLVRKVRPDVVSMENVPRLLNFDGGKVFGGFLSMLESADYNSYDVLYGPDYGLPQTRSRLVLLASRLGTIEMPKPSHKRRHKTVKSAIGSLPLLEAGGVDESDRLHRSSRLSEKNRERIRAAKPGGTWRDWDQELLVRCHMEETGRGYSSVYGRMSWGEPSPTITTQFFGFGNGRFGHPTQDRALSLREGAILQTFPKDYKFVPDDKPVQFKKIGRLIGNAVPVELGRAIARAIRIHLEAFPK